MTDNLQVTPIRNKSGEVISFTISGGTNITKLFEKISREICEHDCEWIDVEGFGSVGICKKCGEKIHDD